MSFDATKWVIDIRKTLTPEQNEKLTKATLLVLTHIASHMNQKTGRCFPKVKVLAESIGCSTKTVRRAIKILCELGLITSTPCFIGRRQTSNTYVLIFAQPVDRGVTLAGVEGHSVPQGYDPMSHRDMTQCPTSNKEVNKEVNNEFIVSNIISLRNGKKVEVTNCPDTIVFNDEHFSLCDSKALNINDQFVRFKEYNRKHNKQTYDWEATFKKWLERDEPTVNALKPDSYEWALTDKSLIDICTQLGISSIGKDSLSLVHKVCDKKGLIRPTQSQLTILKTKHQKTVIAKARNASEQDTESEVMEMFDSSTSIIKVS